MRTVPRLTPGHASTVFDVLGHSAHSPFGFAIVSMWSTSFRSAVDKHTINRTQSALAASESTVSSCAYAREGSKERRTEVVDVDLVLEHDDDARESQRESSREVQRATHAQRRKRERYAYRSRRSLTAFTSLRKLSSPMLRLWWSSQIITCTGAHATKRATVKSCLCLVHEVGGSADAPCLAGSAGCVRRRQSRGCCSERASRQCRCRHS